MPALSRREMLFGALRRARQRASSAPSPPAASTDEAVAVIAGRFCLAYQRSFCSTCYERCPEEGAIVMRDGAPMVVPDRCTGCRVCQDVCPAPTNAVRMIARPAAARPATAGAV